MAKIDLIARTLLMAVDAYAAEAQNVLFLRAAWVAELRDFPAANTWWMEQSFAPYADRLRQSGYEVAPQIAPQEADAALVLATRFAEENKALLARAWVGLRPGGWLVIAQHNDLGAKRLDALLKQLGGEVATVTKHHCRAIATRKTAAQDTLVAEWLAGMAPVAVPGTALHAAPGMFSWRGVDAGSRLLVDSLPATLAGKGADIAAGWGYLSDAVFRRCSAVAGITLYEAEKNALDLAAQNLAGKPASFHWCDAAQPLPGVPAGGFDWAVTNPPAHDLLEDAPDVTAALFAQAAAALKKGASLWLVANRQLPYEKTLESLFSQVRKIQENADFKVLEAVK